MDKQQEDILNFIKENQPCTTRSINNYIKDNYISLMHLHNNRLVFIDDDLKWNITK